MKCDRWARYTWRRSGNRDGFLDIEQCVSDVALRRATSRDPPRIGQISWRANGPSDARRLPSLYEHELATKELFVAERNGQVLGFAPLITRGTIGVLADLSWIQRSSQPVSMERRCAMSSS